MTLDGKILRGPFKHERLKPTIIRTSQGNVQNLVELRKVMNTNIKCELKFINSIPNQLIFMGYKAGYGIKHIE